MSQFSDATMCKLIRTMVAMMDHDRDDTEFAFAEAWKSLDDEEKAGQGSDRAIDALQARGWIDVKRTRLADGGPPILIPRRLLPGGRAAAAKCDDSSDVLSDESD